MARGVWIRVKLNEDERAELERLLGRFSSEMTDKEAAEQLNSALDQLFKQLHERLKIEPQSTSSGSFLDWKILKRQLTSRFDEKRHPHHRHSPIQV